MFGTLNARLQTPLNAMLLQAAIAIAFICLGDGFRSLINFAVILTWLFLFLTVSISPTLIDGVDGLNGIQVLGLIVLRVKEPSLGRYGCGIHRVLAVQDSRNLPLARTKLGSSLL